MRSACTCRDPKADPDSPARAQSACRSTCCATSVRTQFIDALAEGIKENHSEAQAKALEPRVKELGATMAEIKEAKKGMTIALDWNGNATQLMIDGKPAGRPIEGEDFYRALLRIWLGDKPVQEDLKKALLGA